MVYYRSAHPLPSKPIWSTFGTQRTINKNLQHKKLAISTQRPAIHCSPAPVICIKPGSKPIGAAPMLYGRRNPRRALYRKPVPDQEHRCKPDRPPCTRYPRNTMCSGKIKFLCSSLDNFFAPYSLCNFVLLYIFYVSNF